MGLESSDILPNQTPNTDRDYCRSQTVGAKLHVSKGKQPRSQSKVHKSTLSVKGGVVTQTTRMLA